MFSGCRSYDRFRGVVSLIRVFTGTVKKGKSAPRSMHDTLHLAN